MFAISSQGTDNSTIKTITQKKHSSRLNLNPFSMPEKKNLNTINGETRSGLLNRERVNLLC